MITSPVITSSNDAWLAPLQRLLAELRDSDTAAAGHLSNLAEQVAHGAGPSDWAPALEQAQRAVESYDFDAALNALSPLVPQGR